MKKPARKPLRSSKISHSKPEAERRTTPYNPAMQKARALPSHVEHLSRLLPELLRFEHPADNVVSRYFREQPQLGNRDRALIAESSFAFLRRKLELSQFAESGEGPQARRLALLGLMMALSEAGLGSGTRMESALADLAFVVRDDEADWLRRFGAVNRDSLSPQIRANLPDWIWNELSNQIGPDAREKLAQAMLKPAPLDLRVNTLKARREVLMEELNQLGGRYQAIETPFSDIGLRLKGKPALQNLDSFKKGLFEVQDEGSQLLSALLAPKRGQMVVDFCAGAGGKTLALGAMMNSTGRLYAFDVSEKRLSRLKPRVAKSGLSNVHPVWIDNENDAKVKRLAGKIDRVLVDAPCSGLGTLRRNPDLKWRQTPTSIEELNAKQLSILKSAARLLKPGGRLVYATCSVLRQENQDVVNQFLAANSTFELLDAKTALNSSFPTINGLPVGTTANEPWWQLWPHLIETDGFFAAILEKKALVQEEVTPDQEENKEVK